MKEDLYLNTCIAKIEDNLGWGNSTMWSDYEFKKLSDLIHTRTNVSLSVTTLKRIWGKLKYENVPSVATLNVLAQFAGYPDWLGFKLSENNIPRPLPAKPNEFPRPTAPGYAKKFRSIAWFGVATCIIILSYFFFGAIKNNSTPNPNNFIFKARKAVPDGVPNSVLFEYNAMAAKTDSVYIVQTWDISRKTLVSKKDTHHSAIYYYPGFFRTKLIADGQIVKTFDLQITSNGWLGLVEGEKQPFYFNKIDIIKPDRVEIDEQLLLKNSFALKPTAPKIRFFNQRDFGDIMNDNFVFETHVKNEYNGGYNTCHYIEVLIQCKDDIIIIPLCAKECVGNAYLYAAGKELRSKTSDLSGFGADLSQWTTLKVEVINKLMTFYVNGNKATSLTFPNLAAGIVGVQYRFNGPGAIRETSFDTKGKKIRL